MLVLIILIGGNYDWCLGGQAGKVQISQDFLLQQKMVRAKKFVGSFWGAGVVLTYLLDGSFYFWGLQAAPADTAGSLPAA
jgi:hypothetical protein